MYRIEAMKIGEYDITYIPNHKVQTLKSSNPVSSVPPPPPPSLPPFGLRVRRGMSSRIFLIKPGRYQAPAK